MVQHEKPVMMLKTYLINIAKISGISTFDEHLRERIKTKRIVFLPIFNRTWKFSED